MQTVRLVKAYRGYKAGAVITATPGLAATLIASRLAVAESQQQIPQVAERAVAQGQSVESR